MRNTLWVEWLKVRRYRTFWILLAMTILSIPGWTYFLFDRMKNSFPKGKTATAVLGSPFAFPDVWQTVSWNSSLLFIVPAILIITLTTNEFTFRTQRQNVIDGWSRKQFMGAKLVELLLLSIKCTAVVFITTLVFGGLANKVQPGVSIWDGSRFLFFYFVQMLSYSMIAFLMALLIRRAGLAIAAFLIYMLMEEIVVAVLRNLYKLNGVDYLPEEVTDRLIPQPYLRKVLQSPDEMTRWQHHLPIYLLVALLYLIIYCVIAGRRFTTSDL
ncbi:MAG TPA: ABC transporter permease [Puia sp.]|jgi:ABC-2 type transport system permease protein|nr:ABC transporter permease [Puia sp.]